MSPQLALRYAVIRYVPYLETREFATVGVVAVCPKTGYFDYKLTTLYSRFSHFFPEFDAATYKAAISYFAQELDAIKNLTRREHLSVEFLRSLFDQVTRDREAIVCTSQPRVRLVAKAEQGLEYLFNYYVNHSFISKETAQEVLTKRVVDLVKNLPLRKPFKERRLGGSIFHATFPLVQMDNLERAERIIKPLSLHQPDPNKMYEHADLWVGRVNRLKQTKEMSDSTSVLFAYEPPQVMSSSQQEAFQMILDLMNKSDITHTEAKNENSIMEFVKERV